MQYRYKEILNLETMPLDQYNCYILTYKRKVYKNFYKYFIWELSYIFKFFDNLDYHIIIYERDINDFEDIFNLDCISKLVESDILVIVFKY